MKIYTDILLLALLTVYVVDVSGFTQGWRSLVAGWLKVQHLRDLPPFDCGKCMTWWVCAIYAVCAKYATLPVFAYCGLLSLLSEPIGQLMHATRELLGLLPRYLLSLCVPRKKS
jgi:hypothetical protein